MFDTLYIDNQEYGTGLLPDPTDKRDKEFDHLALTFAPFDWDYGYDVEQELGFTLPIKNQFKSSSCVGQATAQYAYVLNSLEFLPIYGLRTRDVVPEMSAKSIYSLIHLIGGGAYTRDAAKLLVKRGINTEAQVPSYDLYGLTSELFMRETTWLSKKRDEEAKNFQAKEYRSVVAKYDIHLVAQAVQAGHGCLLGVIGGNNGTWHSQFPQIGEKEWGHLVYAGKAKMINGKIYIGILNSWGDKIGQWGWQWLSQEWFTSGRIMNPWTVIDKWNTDWIKLLDRNGKPRLIPTYMAKAINYLVNKRNYTLV